mmetsp:Transcript_8584/g.24840  ORF Transcript_8584/g.24840 Transcript_8584/m.24840 type:complete len:556 (-) Transcript_8584:176-1843(-)
MYIHIPSPASKHHCCFTELTLNVWSRHSGSGLLLPVCTLVGGNRGAPRHRASRHRLGLDHGRGRLLFRYFRHFRKIVRVVSVAIAAEPLRRVALRKWDVMREAERQVRVRDEGAAEADRRRIPRGDRRLGRVARVAAVADERALVDGLHRLQRERVSLLMEAKAQAVHHVHKGEVARAQLLQRVRERLDVVLRAHVVVHAVGAQAHAYAVGVPDGEDGVENLVQEAHAVLHGTAVRIGALVRAGLQERVEQVAVGRVHLDAVEASLLRERGRAPVVLDDSCDLVDGQCAGLLVRLLGAVSGVHTVGAKVGAVDGDSGWRHDLLAAEEGAVRRAAHVPHLVHDPAAIGVHGVVDALPALHLLARVEASGVCPAVGGLGDGGGLSEDQAAVHGAVGVVLDEVIVGHAGRTGAAAREGGCEDAVAHIDGADRARGEKVRGLVRRELHVARDVACLSDGGAGGTPAGALVAVAGLLLLLLLLLFAWGFRGGGAAAVCHRRRSSPGQWVPCRRPVEALCTPSGHLPTWQVRGTAIPYRLRTGHVVEIQSQVQHVPLAAMQ